MYKANLIRRLGSAPARQTPVEVATRARDGKTESPPTHDSGLMTSMKTGHANATMNQARLGPNGCAWRGTTK